MATVIDSLLITLGVDPSGVKKGMAQASQSIDSGVKSIVQNLAAPLAGALAFTSMFNSFITQGTQLSALSSKLGRDVREIDAWSAAVEQAGGSASAFRSTLASFDKGLRSAAVSGGGGNLEMLYLLGIRATDARGKLRSLTDILPDLAKRIEGMSNARSRTILEKMGLDDGTIMLLQKGGKAVEDLMRDMRDFAFTKRDTDAADAFSGAMSGLKRAGQSVANVLFRELVPIVVKLSGGMKEFFRVLVQHEPFVLSFFAVLTAASSKFLLAWVSNPVTLAILAIIAVVGALALVIDDLVVYMRGGESALEGFWSQFGTGEEILATLKSAWNGLINSLQRFKNLLPAAGVFLAYGGAIKVFDGITAAVNGVKSAMTALKVVAATNPLGLLLLAAALLIVYWDDIVAGAIWVKNEVVRLAEIAGPFLQEKFDEAIEAVKAKFAEWGESFSQLWDDFTNAIPSWEDIKTKLAGISTNLLNYFKSVFKDIWASLLSSMPDWAKKLLGLDAEAKSENREKGLEDANLYASETPISNTSAPVFVQSLPYNYGAKQQAVSQALSRTENNTSRTDINSNVNVGTVNITAPDGDAQNIAGVFGNRLNDIIFAAQTGTIQK